MFGSQRPCVAPSAGQITVLLSPNLISASNPKEDPRAKIAKASEHQQAQGPEHQAVFYRHPGTTPRLHCSTQRSSSYQRKSDALTKSILTIRRHHQSMTCRRRHGPEHCPGKAAPDARFLAKQESRWDPGLC